MFLNSNSSRNKFWLFSAATVGLALMWIVTLACPSSGVGQEKKKQSSKPLAVKDAKNESTGKVEPFRDPDFAQYAIYAKTAPVAELTQPVVTRLPLKLQQGDRIAFIGNTLLDRAQQFGYFETLLHQAHSGLNLRIRNLSWSADTPDIQPRPANFASTEQHLTHEKVDVIFAAYGYNESFDGAEGLPEFRSSLSRYVTKLKSRAFNGKHGPRIVLLSPIANENIANVPAGDLNNARIAEYAKVVRSVAAEQNVGYVDVFTPTLAAFESAETDLTFNGAHMLEAGYKTFSNSLFKSLFNVEPPQVNEKIRSVIVDKNRQYFRRFRPLNTFYYTGDRSGTYGYLDFLPAMKNFDIMVDNREKHVWALASGKSVPENVDDSNLPELPETKESRGANRWVTAEEELKSFTVDPRFEVTLFAGEEEFPDIAAPIQIRWDAKGRLWVSCSKTYPHVYPGNEPDDKIVVLEDTDGDGKADKSTVFADDLHIPLSFEFGDGGVYVSEEPHLTFLKDTDGDGKADFRRKLLTGFGCEDSHHALHDFAWTPDGDLIFRDAIFLHTQVETPYGPIRQNNSGWYRFEPKTQRLTSFGTYHSTNPWGVTFDDWGNHVASHPIFAAAFHSLDPPYPMQHPKPTGLQAYSGTCGQEFVDFATFPKELQGGFIKARYKPTNRIEIHRWIENDFGYEEKYVSDLIFSSNLSFIPVDIRFGPRGAMYVCDWYNPIKGHAQYSLRDERRDRHSGRIWRITAKGIPLQEPPAIAGVSIPKLLDILKMPEYRYRYWAKRELRERSQAEVKEHLDRWVGALDPTDTRYRHHQVEAIWMYRNIDSVNLDLLRELLACDEHHARAAATQQLRYWHHDMPDAIEWLRKSANDENGLVRMEAAIAGSYIGSRMALDAILEIANHPTDKHLAYAFNCALGSHTMRAHWEGKETYAHIELMLKRAQRGARIAEPAPNANDAQFDSQTDLNVVRISCLPERMKFSKEQFVALTGQPVKLVFTNPDATDHNLVIVKPGALEEVGMAANDMAKNPRFAKSDFVPREKLDLILDYSPMIGPNRKRQVEVMRFEAPTEPGIYPFVCTFPGHWIVMKGEMIVVENLNDVEELLATRTTPTFVKKWTMEDFESDLHELKGRELMKGMQAFMNARCNQCHAVQGHGATIAPDLTKVAEKYKGKKLLQQILHPSTELNDKYRAYQILTLNGEVIVGTVYDEDENSIQLIQNLLTPQVITTVLKKDIDEQVASKLSSMPEGLVDVLTKEELLDLMAFLEAGGYQLPDELQKQHSHQH